jgi:hypothetical protein
MRLLQYALYFRFTFCTSTSPVKCLELVATFPSCRCFSYGLRWKVRGAYEGGALMQAMIQQTKSLTSRPFGIDLIVEDTAFGPCTTVQHIEVCLAEHVHMVAFF